MYMIVCFNLPQNMIGEMFLAAEAFATDFTTERIFICVGALMIGQMFFKKKLYGKYYHFFLTRLQC